MLRTHEHGSVAYPSGECRLRGERLWHPRMARTVHSRPGIARRAALKTEPRRTIRRRRRSRKTYAQHVAVERGLTMRQLNNLKSPITSQANIMRKSKTLMRKLVLS